MTIQENELTDFIKEIKKVKEKRLEKHARLSQSIELLNHFMSEYGMPTDKYRGIFQTALDVIGHFNEVTLVMNEEIILKNREINGDRKLLEYADEKITEHNYLNDKVTNQLEILKDEGKKNKRRLESAANSTKARYEHTLVIAKEVVQAYAKEYPKRLSDSCCVRGVKADLDRRIHSIMSKPEEYKKSKLFNTPDKKTIIKYRDLALEDLGYSSN